MYETDVTAIHINIPAASSYVTGEMSRRNGLLVHEGQHAVLALKTNFSSSGKYMWLNEGFAVTVMDYLWGGIDSSGWLNGIARECSNPQRLIPDLSVLQSMTRQGKGLWLAISVCQICDRQDGQRL